jgi:dTDP-4-amino-4,6-dideoxygalactose transaminase
VNALIGIDQIRFLDYFRKKRNYIVKNYIEKLSKFKKNFEILNFPNSKIFWHLFVINLKNYRLKKKLMIFLKKNKIGTQVHYKPLFLHKVYKKNILLNHSKKSLLFYNSQLSLPLHSMMSIKDMNKVSKKLNEFFISEKK